MAVRLTFAEMLDRLKAETNASQNVAHGIAANDQMKYLLKRTQEELYVAHDWPMLVIERDVPVLKGVRYYNYPADLNFEFINDVWVRYGTIWQRLGYNISPEDFNVYNSDQNFQTFPPRKWQHYVDGGNDLQFEIWPIPSDNGTLRFRGRKALSPLVSDTDKSTLDGNLIVMFAAAETLARLKGEDAGLKLQKAKDYLRMLKSRQGAAKEEPLVIGGGGRPNVKARVGLDFIPPGFGKDGRG
jgi:hypothetical protein